MVNDQNLKSFGTRLDKDLIVELRIRAAVTCMSLQDILDAAVRMWLEQERDPRG